MILHLYICKSVFYRCNIIAFLEKLEKKFQDGNKRLGIPTTTKLHSKSKRNTRVWFVDFLYLVLNFHKNSNDGIFSKSDSVWEGWCLARSTQRYDPSLSGSEGWETIRLNSHLPVGINGKLHVHIHSIINTFTTFMEVHHVQIWPFRRHWLVQSLNFRQGARQKMELY